VKSKKTARTAAGKSTNDLVVSAYHGTNDQVFPEIMRLYAAPGARVADVTYGRGVFWRSIQPDRYQLVASDLKADALPAGCAGGIDACALPYADASFDVIVFDPPYMHSPGGTAHNGHQNFERFYANNADAPGSDEPAPPKYHEAVLDLYFRASREAWRVLVDDGVYIVKCQDEVCANRQRLTHIEITVELARYGFDAEDVFVLMRRQKPGVSRLKGRQVHARKNHSYFMVYRKPRPSRRRNGV
jgi:hypothetical protein